MLNPELKQKWLAALRSGDYKQGRTVLYTRSDDSFCCLGVLGYVSGMTKEDLDPTTPYTFLKDMGLNDEMIETLWSMNDIRRCSFEEIANYIESRKDI